MGGLVNHMSEVKHIGVMLVFFFFGFLLLCLLLLLLFFVHEGSNDSQGFKGMYFCSLIEWAKDGRRASFRITLVSSCFESHAQGPLDHALAGIRRT